MELDGSLERSWHPVLDRTTTLPLTRAADWDCGSTPTTRGEHFHYLLHTTYYSLPTTHYSPPTTYYALLIFTTHHRLPTTEYRVPTTDYRLLTTDYRLPTAYGLGEEARARWRGGGGREIATGRPDTRSQRSVAEGQEAGPPGTRTLTPTLTPPEPPDPNPNPNPQPYPTANTNANANANPNPNPSPSRNPNSRPQPGRGNGRAAPQRQAAHLPCDAAHRRTGAARACREV